MRGDPPIGVRRGTTGFEAQLNAFVHRRLRLCAVVLSAATLAILLTLMATRLLGGDWREQRLLDASRVVVLASLAVGVAFVVVLGRRSPSTRALRAMDAALVWCVILACAAYYAAAWRIGPIFLVPVLGLLLLGRAVLVPSRPLRTLLISLPAMPAVAAVALAHGEFYADTDLRHPASSFWPLFAWNQVVLAISVALAVIASRVNFRLRREVYEATSLGPFVLEEKIGEGAMGEVYRARHTLLRRPTAVKVIRAGIADERTIGRFEQEVRQTARLTHPNTIAVFDYGRTPEGTFYYAMELLDGVDLDTLVQRSGPMPASRVIHVLAQACEALEEAHEAGLVHRDVKASNLILCARGLVPDVVKVMDFGLVKDTRGDDSELTDAGAICGSPETMAPEMLRGREVGPGADVYALGAVGCFLLAGRQPFDAATIAEFVSKHLRAEPVPPSERGVEVPADLEALLLHCLAKDPDDRPASAAALRDELLHCADAGRWSRDDAARWWAEWRSGARD